MVVCFAEILQNGDDNVLLEFKTKNYKSFAEETSFSMMPAPKQTGLDYSLCKEKIKGKTVKGLCSSVIYGANASGKTNIIGAMDVFRAVVLRGNIKNSEDRSSPNPASAVLELIPNNNLSEPQPVAFHADFVESGLRFVYNIAVDLGAFLDAQHERKIIEEKLTVNGEVIFTRADNLYFGDFKIIKNYLADSVLNNKDTLIDIAKNSLIPEELFLVNGFKLIISNSLVKIITDWFMNKFMVIYRADSMELIQRFTESPSKAIIIEETTNKAAKQFGINSNALGYIINDENSEERLCSIFKDINKKKNVVMPAEFFESYGTIRFINMFPLVIKAIRTGGTLVVDEFDASIHPMALMSMINIFHNDDINVKHAQLIFNTHNPIFLNSNLFRRDEIKFVERDDESHYSTLYSLSDFGTAGDNGVRKHEDYMKNYFVSRYGAIKDIDFTPIFEELNTSDGGTEK